MQRRRIFVAKSEGGGGGDKNAKRGCDDAGDCDGDGNPIVPPQHPFERGSPHWDGRLVVACACRWTATMMMTTTTMKKNKSRCFLRCYSPRRGSSFVVRRRCCCSRMMMMMIWAGEAGGGLEVRRARVLGDHCRRDDVDADEGNADIVVVPHIAMHPNQARGGHSSGRRSAPPPRQRTPHSVGGIVPRKY